MSDQTDKLIILLKPFGLTDEESKIYLNLLENNTLGALSISRNLHIGRTKVYRILDKLIEKQLVTQQLDDAGFKFKANHPSQLDLILNKKEIELSNLKKTLPKTLDILKDFIGTNKPESKVLFYRGKEGLSQVNWNLLKTKGEFLSYEVSTADAYMPHNEAEKLRQQLFDKKIYSRSLSNLEKLGTFSSIKEIEKFQKINYISPKIITIKADIFIYNDIYTICHFLEDGDIFCLEMQNATFANLQRQIFENLWSQSTPISKT
ncbi:MAG: helix-turn-helix domain-containing protein [Candidatus Shapirobacteria bacterium]